MADKVGIRLPSADTSGMGVSDSNSNFLKTNKTVSGSNPAVVTPKTIWDNISKETRKLISTQKSSAEGVHPFFQDPEFIKFYEANNGLSYQTRIGLWEQKLATDAQIKANGGY